MARTHISKLLESTGAFSMLLRVRGAVRSPWVTVLTYHRVAHPGGSDGLYDGVVDARPEAFERQLSYLGKYCNVISIEDLLEFRKGASLPPNPVLITFDDGYLDNHDVALPMLQRHGMKAVFFIATHYLSERRLFWWDRVSYMLKASTKETLELTYPRKVSLVLGASGAERARTVRRVLAVVKAHFGLDLARFLEEVERASGVSLARDVERQKVDELLMTWDHVRALKRAGMAVESHTRTHRVLQTLSRADLDDELGGSREELEGILGSKVSAVAYPVGYGLHSAPEARLAVRAAGYELGFSNNRGMNHAWKFDPLDVKQMSLELDLPDSYFRGMVALPYFAYEPAAQGRVTRV
jgi:peptidoglycan/xylan/chitin deacetylase (PgdA/CDA1 family)